MIMMLTMMKTVIETGFCHHYHDYAKNDDSSNSNDRDDDNDNCYDNDNS